MSLTRNTPCEAGRQLGAALARWADQAAPGYAASHAEKGMPVPQRCATCAFRAGTYPNGCLTSTSDALKCSLEHVEFCCHEKDAIGPDGERRQCVGYAMLVHESQIQGRGPRKAPWPFSDEITESTRTP